MQTSDIIVCNNCNAYNKKVRSLEKKIALMEQQLATDSQEGTKQLFSCS
jgi:hypothetical protein